MKMLRRSIVLFFATLLVTGCELDGAQTQCDALIGVETTAVTGPTEVAINEEIMLAVTHKVSANCGAFDSFYQDPESTLTDRIITVITTYDSCACDDVVTTSTASYGFKSTVAGVFVLKFKKTNTTFITHTITVE